jgi:hypothetical protein
MTDAHELTQRQKILFAIIVLSVTLAHILLTAVVVLFLLSTINILNDSVLHFQSVKPLELTVIAGLFLLSGILFIRSFQKVSRFIKITFFPYRPR